MNDINARNEALSLLDVAESQPSRSETLKTFMKNKGLTDNDVLYEDEKVISFHPENNINFNRGVDYDKTTDMYDGINHAQYENDRIKKLHDHYDEVMNKNPEEDLHNFIQNEIANYSTGIRTRSKGGVSDRSAMDMAESKFGSFKDIENYLANRKKL